MKKTYLNILRFLLGIFLLLILFSKIGFEEIFGNLLKTNIYQFLIILLVPILSVIFGAINMGVLLRFLRFRIRFLSLLRIYSLSWAFGLFLPGRLGELSIIPLLKNKGLDYGKGAAVSLIDKGITFFVLAFFTIFAIFIYLPKNQAINILIILSILTILLMALFITKMGRHLIKKFTPRSITEKFYGFSEALFLFIKKGKIYLFINLVLTIIKQVILTLIVYLTFLTFGINFSFTSTLLVISAITIISLVPISISGLGIRESSAVFLFGLLGLDTVIVGTVFTLFLILKYLVGSLIIYFIKIEN